MASKSSKPPQTSLGKGSKPNPKRSPKSPSTPKQNKPRGTMGLGLLLIAIGTSLIGLGGLGYFVYQELLSSAKREVDQSAEAKTRQFESKLANVRQTVGEVANSARTLAVQPAKPKIDTYQKLAADSLQKSESIAGLGIAQNENQLFVTPKPLFPYVWKEQVGLKVEGASQKLAAPNDKLLSGNRPDIPNTASFKTAVKGKAAWSEPYNALGRNIITYSAPITDGQKVFGVVNADAIADNLLALANTATNPDPSSESKIGLVVVSGSGKVVTASNAFQAAQTQNPAIAESLNVLAQQAKAQPSGIAQTGGNLWAYRKLEGSELLVAAYVPETEIINKVLILVGATALGISTILAIAVLGFVNSLKKRLKPITEECDRFLSQQGTNANLGGKDEIEQLSLSLKSTLQQVKTQEIKLRSELKQVTPQDEVTDSQDSAANELMEAEVGDLLDVVSSMEEGDLTIEAQVNDRATGLVADTLNRLREKLVEIISSVLGTAQQVAQGAADLEELARTVVLNTAEQAQSVAQGQALTEQVATIAQRSAEQVNVANESLQEVRETVASGQSAINNLTEGISVLQSGSSQIVQRMKTLGEFVGLAEQFVQDQGQIASLTQVLALNATLVAARAAEQKDPKQFASVAREFESIAGQVNDLATQTNEGLTVLQQRTSQIQTVVTAIDAEVQNLSGLVSGFTTGVEASQSAFNSIQVATEEVVQIGQAITDSSTEIAEAAGSTASYISEIAQLAERTADLTRSARQQAEAMGNQAQQLLQGIQFFRLPESALAGGIDATTAEPLYRAEESSSVENFVATEPDSSSDSGLGVVLPAIAVTAATVAVSQSLNNAPEREIDQNAIASTELDKPNDRFSLDEDLTTYQEEINPESFIGETDDQLTERSAEQLSEQFMTLPEEQEINTYSELTDISVIEQSLLDDLRHEIYEEDPDSSEIIDPLAMSPEPLSSLKNPMEGVDELAINGVSDDPMVISATSSFLEDTAFGNPSPLSEEALANLPTSVDFSIPDMDDGEDFSLPNLEIHSSLDSSNSFFDSTFDSTFDSASGTLDANEATDLEAFGSEQQLEQSISLTDYSNDADFSSDYSVTELAETVDINHLLEEDSTDDFGIVYGDEADSSADLDSAELDASLEMDYTYTPIESFVESSDLDNAISDQYTESFVESRDLDNAISDEYTESFVESRDLDNAISDEYTESFAESSDLEASIADNYVDYSDMSTQDEFAPSYDNYLEDSTDEYTDNYAINYAVDNYEGSQESGVFSDYSDYLANEDLNESLEDSLESTPNEAFIDSYDTSFDEVPFDRALDEALNSSLNNTITEESLESDAESENLEFEDSDAAVNIELDYQELSSTFDLDLPSNSVEASLDEFDEFDNFVTDNFLETPTAPEVNLSLVPEVSPPSDFFSELEESLSMGDLEPEDFAGFTQTGSEQQDVVLVQEGFDISSDIRDLNDTEELPDSFAFDLTEDTVATLDSEIPSINLDLQLESDAGEAIADFTDGDDTIFGLSNLSISQDDATDADINSAFDLDVSSWQSEESNEFDVFSNPLSLDESTSIADSFDLEPEVSADISFTPSIESVADLETAESEALSGFAEGLDPDLGLMEFSETNIQTLEDSSPISERSPIGNVDFDDSSIFDSLAEDLSDGLDNLDFGASEMTEGSGARDTTESNSAFEMPEIDIPEIIANTTTSDNDLGLDFATDWLEELSGAEEVDDSFATNSLDSLEDPSIIDIATTQSANASYDFTNDLLDSLMDEGDDDLNASPMSLDDLASDDISSEINDDSDLEGNDIEYLNTAQDDLSLDFDFTAFEESISDLNDPLSQSVGQSVASAKAEIDDFLSSSFNFDDEVQEKTQTPTKPKVPVKTDEDL